MERHVTAVIPAYNEEKILPKTIHAVQQIDVISEIIVVNDGSNDHTRSAILNYPITLIEFSRNRGKGAALFTGTDFSVNDYVAFIDADLGDTALEISNLIYPVLFDETDIAVACFKHNSGSGFGIVKGFAKWSAKILTRQTSDAILSGQRVMPKLLAKQLLEKEKFSRYGVEWGMTVEAFKSNYRVLDIVVPMEHRWTLRNFSGILHRSKQFQQVLFNFLKKL